MGVRASAWTLLFTSAGFVVAALLSFRRGPFIDRASMFPVASALCAGGTALCLLLRAVAPGDALSALFLAALLIAAFGNAFLLVMWGELWATLATDRVSQYLLSSYAFAFVLFFGVQALPSVAAAAIVCLLPGGVVRHPAFVAQRDAARAHDGRIRRRPAVGDQGGGGRGGRRAGLRRGRVVLCETPSPPTSP